jgi:hypothetical protein
MIVEPIQELIQLLYRVRAQSEEMLADLAGFEDEVNNRFYNSLTGRIAEIRDMVTKVAEKKIKSNGGLGTVYIAMDPPLIVTVFGPGFSAILDPKYTSSLSNMKTYSPEQFIGKLNAMIRNVEADDWMDALIWVRSNQCVTAESLDM